MALEECRQLLSRTEVAIDVWAKMVEQLTACHLEQAAKPRLQLTLAVDRQPY